MADHSPSWNDGQVAALALIASSLVGDALPNPFGSWLAGIPVVSTLTLMVAFPVVVMVPVLFVIAARAGWRDRSPGAGIRLGSIVSFLTTVIVLLAYVAGLALGQPQLLKIGLGWESVRDLALMLVTTTGFGVMLAGAGSAAGAIAGRFFQRRAPSPL